MQFRTTVFTAALALPLVHAVNINLFWSIFEDQCDHSEPYASCTNINADVCCVYSSPFFSAEGTGLYTEDVPDVIAAFTGSIGQCSVSCNSGGGDNTECVQCQGTTLSGAIWYRFGTRKGPVAAVSETVYADRIGLWDTALGAHRHFNISAGVPSAVVAELDAALKNGTRAELLSGQVLPYEIK
ncbi:hypothetical protein C8A03DRAFT_36278 [Achaetomium macrosporum]|uniref:Uncharacterized protein n=1 Tax=Achaetomium macrosporum TaxID=79813 RepID=A0AAN7C5L9_9PEZI|nr:hypothetical protein C8A03DRAFT_36278 [Achaetomium macrosporum]